MNRNTKRKLENLAKFIEKLPRKSFDIKFWAKKTLEGTKNDPDWDAIVNKKNVELCGTKCCIAGWQLVRKGYGVGYGGEVYKDKKSTNDYAWQLAATQLGLSSEEAGRLFYPDYYNGERATKTFNNTPKGAAKRIRHFIETGE